MKKRTVIRPMTLVINVIFYLVLLAIAAAALWPIYQSTHFILLAAVTCAVGVIIAVASTVWRWKSYAVLGAIVGVFLLFGVPLAVPEHALAGVAPSIAGIRELVLGTVLSWKQLVTVDLPVGSYEALLVPAFIMLLVASSLGLILALRTTLGSLAAVFPGAVLIAGIVLGAREEFYPLVFGLGFFVAAVLWSMWRGRRARRDAVEALNEAAGASRMGDNKYNVAIAPDGGSFRSRNGAIRPVLAAVGVLALGVGAGVSGAHFMAPESPRDVIRSAIERPFDPRDYSSPLSGFRSYLQPENADAVALGVKGLEEGERVRIATLDTFNGIVFNVGSDDQASLSGSFARVPSRVDQSGITGRSANLEFTIGDYQGVWVPTVGNTTTIDFDGERAAALGDSFYFNRTSNTGAAVAKLQSGDSYRVSTIIPSELSAEDWLEVKPGKAKTPRPLDVPEELTDTVRQLTENLDSPGEKLAAVAAHLSQNGYISHGIDETRPFSRSGHAADRLAQLLSEIPMLGDGEQYAPTLALMAGELGFPARVVVGFMPEDAEQIRNNEIAAWVEVNVEGAGWVPLDATPPDRDVPPEIPDDQQEVSQPKSILPPPPSMDDTPVEPNRPDAEPDEPDTEDQTWAIIFAILRIVGVVLLVVAVIAAPFMAVLIAKATRRRRRKKDARELGRITGGWQEIVDAATDYGYETPRTSTRTELAEAIGHGGVAVLARQADSAVFGPAHPTPEAADVYWKELNDFRAEWARDYSRWERFKARYSLRSFYRGPKGSRPSSPRRSKNE